ncbi:MAG: hypothetical protein KGL46_10035 [Hyphomicrobiales bacterium]|nr:hypothetical protein [Hyphomicrobiales bacterium]
MKVWFHALAATLLASALWMQFTRQRAPASTDLQSSLTQALLRAGYTPEGAHERIGGEHIMSFTRPDCATPMRIVLIPTLHRDSTQAVMAAQNGGPPPVYIYRGEPVAGPSFWSVTPPWLARQLRAAFALGPEISAWDAALLAVFEPQDCAEKPIEWPR